MNLKYEGRTISADEAIALAENHGIQLEDAEYIVECLETGHPYDLQQYKDVRNGEYVKCFAAFLSKVSAMGSAPTIGKKGGGEVSAAPMEVSSVDANNRIKGAIAHALSEHFTEKENGAWELRRDNPPTIAEAYNHAAYLMDLREKAKDIETIADWTLGSVIFECEEYFGDEFSFTQIADISGKTDVYCRVAYRCAKWAKENWKPKLPMTTASEIIVSKCDDEQKVEAIKMAEEAGLSQSKTRKLARRLIAGDTPEEIAGDDLNKNLETKSFDMWGAKFPKGWYKGPLDSTKIIKGAEVAINFTRKKLYVNNREILWKNLSSKRFISREYSDEIEVEEQS